MSRTSTAHRTTKTDGTVPISGTVAILGSVTTIPNDYFVDVARCQLAGHRVLQGLGERNGIGTTIQGEDLWLGNDLSNTPQALDSHTFIPSPADAGEQMTLISESGNDHTSGSGAQYVSVFYLDGSGDQQSVVMGLSGTTGVNLTPSDVRYVQELQVKSVGSNTVADGNIRIYKTANPGAVYNMIAAGGNQSLVPHRMVPSGKTLYLQNWTAGETREKRMFIRLRADCNNEWPPIRQQNVFLFKGTIGCNGNPGPNVPLSIAVPEFSIVKVSAFAVATLGEAFCHWWGVLIDN